MNGARRTPAPLMLGYGWFPDRLGGLNRYYRDLLEQLPEASGVVVGGNGSLPARVTAVSDHDRPLPHRLVAVWRAAQRQAGSVDVVDAHFALYALAPVWLGPLRKKPMVLHFHGPWADESAAAGDGSTLRIAGKRMLERAVYRRAEQVVVLSSAFRQVLVERYRVSPWNINVIPPGVDLARFSPGDRDEARRRLGIEPEAFVAVSVRRLVPRMGLETMLDAWRAAVADLPEPSSLLIAGDGPLRTTLARAATEPGHEGTIRLLGRVSDDQLVDLYRAADIAIVPTQQHEGFGLVVIEAAACGTASIVTSVGGLPEAMAGLNESLIVPPGDAVALRDEILRVQRDRPARAEIRIHAERYSWPSVAERHRELARRAATRARTDRRLRIVYLDHVARLSGAEIALLRLLPHLDRVNAHVIVAEDGPLVAKLHLAGISTEVLPLQDAARQLRKGDVRRGGVTAAAAATTTAYVLRLAARLRELRPDLVHTNSLKAGVYGSVAAKLAGVPVIWHVRDRIAEDYLPPAAVKLIRAMSRRLATAIVANSRATMETLAAPTKPVVIYSVLPEVVRALPPRARATDTPLTFGIVGRLAPWKGQDLFLDAFAKAFPDGPEQAAVIGAALFGEDDYADTLVDVADGLGIANRVDFRGHQLKIWDELARLDVLVHASITAEPFGQVVLEGMAAGVPVIAAGAGGPAEMINHNVTGLLFEPRDADGLASAMRRLRDPALRTRLAGAAREGLGRYSPEVVAEELQDVYEKVMARQLWR